MAILKKYLKNNCKGFSYSHRWVRERNEVARLGNGIDIHTYIHDNENYVTNNLIS